MRFSERKKREKHSDNREERERERDGEEEKERSPVTIEGEK